MNYTLIKSYVFGHFPRTHANYRRALDCLGPARFRRDHLSEPQLYRAFLNSVVEHGVFFATVDRADMVVQGAGTRYTGRVRLVFSEGTVVWVDISSRLAWTWLMDRDLAEVKLASLLRYQYELAINPTREMQGLASIHS
ncbi:hypothetical protein CLV84_3479 [Neolewinella xylanilytica]|uniref:Uncharacterized protein n=1 Tax=Neolewinella xylanilytica TaxID=1514080 RepID=A0A2S6I5V7_9BACT|nr:hypothetical protein [Neolewinella xylanilytica]PPK86546.1 hypothetical protein CLV84_3479 [Neolewinella xylanilytica]